MFNTRILYTQYAKWTEIWLKFCQFFNFTDHLKKTMTNWFICNYQMTKRIGRIRFIIFGCPNLGVTVGIFYKWYSAHIPLSDNSVFLRYERHHLIISYVIHIRYHERHIYTFFQRFHHRIVINKFKLYK